MNDSASTFLISLNASARSTEAATPVDLMKAFGLIEEGQAQLWKSRLNTISKMLWGLMR